MPLYVFENESGVTTELFYKMAEAPSVGSQVTDDQGVTWRRVFTRPNAAIATTCDPYSASDFNKSLDGKSVTLGNMWDHSAEMSAKRASKEGRDPVKDKYLKDYSKQRKGMEHSVAKREKFNAVQKELGLNINL